MSRMASCVVLIGCLGLCAAAQAQMATSSPDKASTKRQVTVADAITMTQIGDRSYLDAFTKTGNVAQFSPDGSKFAFVTQKGNLENDAVEFCLLVFKTADAFTSPRGDVVATLASSSNREAISHVEWLRDNDTLVFLGEQPGESPQLYKVSSTTKRLERLTKHPTAVIAYSVSDRGDSFVYVAEVKPEPTLSEETRRRGFVVTSQRWDDLYTNHQRVDWRKDIFVQTPRMASATRVGGSLYLYPEAEGIQLKVSPNGQYALINAYATSPPAAWSAYKPGFQTLGVAAACAAGETYRCPQEHLLVDLNKLTIEPLIDAPIMLAPGVGEPFAWTSQNSVLLVNTFLPLASVDTEEHSQRLHNVYAAEVLLPSRQITKIAERKTPFHVFDIQSDSAKNRFVIQPPVVVGEPPLELRKDADHWKVTEIRRSDVETGDQLSVTLEQDMNSPPKLVANDPKTKRKGLLLDLNPQFADLTFGRVEVFRWKTRDGHSAEGSLYYPPDYVIGKKYPLVIQTHGNSRERFWIDGPFTTAFAAQPLANCGFLVLQMGIGDRYDKASLDEWTNIMSTSQEGPYTVAFLESAVDELDRRGLIDRIRVGLSGFSRTVYHVLYTLTHSSYHIAASVLADGANFGYVNCVYAPVFGPTCEKMNGGLPYGATLSNWAKEAPTFRLDQLEAPVLLQAISAPLGEWEILAGLRWLKKPVELLNFYPEGQHVLVRPQQRLLSQGSVVDWYCFWLKGEEDPDPAKAEQYARWRRMKQERDSRAARAGN